MKSTFHLFYSHSYSLIMHTFIYVYNDAVTTVSPHSAVVLESVNIIERPVSRGWADASARCLQVRLYCAALCQTVSLQYCLHCRRFLLHGLQVVTRELHRSSLKRLMCLAQDHTTDFVYQFSPLSDPDVARFVLECGVDHMPT